MPLFRSGVSNFRVKGYKGKRSIQTISQKSDKHMKGISTIKFWQDSNRNFGKTAGQFHIVFRMNKAREISHF